jgi:hypothetical protein
MKSVLSPQSCVDLDDDYGRLVPQDLSLGKNIKSLGMMLSVISDGMERLELLQDEHEVLLGEMDHIREVYPAYTPQIEELVSNAGCSDLFVKCIGSLEKISECLRAKAGIPLKCQIQ